MNNCKRVYLAGGMTSVSDPAKLKRFYEEIGAVCEEIGLEVYIPHLYTDPVDHPGITPKEVYETNMDEVEKADLVVAYVGEPSLGVGIELGVAKDMDKIIIIHSKKDAKVSRMALGRAKAHITYDNFDQGVGIIKKELNKIINGYN